MNVRRMIDVLVGGCCLLLVAPGMLLIALCIKQDSPGPVFYIPKMVGQHGRLFPLLRFRTMYVERANQHAQNECFTPIGSFIRTYSLDHLPMLINLLIGHITLTGPRPMELDVVDLHDPIWQTYLEVKPGVFNAAVLQLGKTWTPSRTSHPQRNQTLELAYRAQQSFWSDVKLVMQFLYALIRSNGNIKARKEPDVSLDP